MTLGYSKDNKEQKQIPVDFNVGKIRSVSQIARTKCNNEIINKNTDRNTDDVQIMAAKMGNFTPQI